MSRVLKYWLDKAPRTVLSLPDDAVVVCVHEQNGYATIWLTTNKPHNTSRQVAFNCVSTGQNATGQYVGTAHIHDGRTVVHVFMEDA